MLWSKGKKITLGNGTQIQLLRAHYLTKKWEPPVSCYWVLRGLDSGSSALLPRTPELKMGSGQSNRGSHKSKTLAMTLPIDSFGFGLSGFVFCLFSVFVGRRELFTCLLVCLLYIKKEALQLGKLSAFQFQQFCFRKTILMKQKKIATFNTSQK